MKIPQVKGLIKYTWVFLLPKDSQIPLPSPLIKDKRVSVSKRNEFCSKIKYDTYEIIEDVI